MLRFLPLLIVMAIAGGLLFWQRLFVQDPFVQDPLSPLQTSSPPDMQTVTADQLTYPPRRQTFTTGSYQFVVAATNQWQTPTATGTLYEGDRRLWQSNLPHEYGPRFVLVSPTGQVLLVDEFINVASPYALTLLDRAGNVIAQYSFDDIKRTLDVSSAELTQQATSGWWISAPPTLGSTDDAAARSGAIALIQTGGTTLEVNLATGELNRRASL